MRYIYESILDNVEQTDSQSSQTVAANSSSFVGDHLMTVAIHKLFTDTMEKSGLKTFQIEKMDDVLNDFISTLSIADAFSVDYSLYYKENDYLPCEQFVEKVKEENPMLVKYAAVSLDSIFIQISYQMTDGHTFKMFADAVFGIYRVVYQLLTETFKFRINTASSINILFDDEVISHNIKDLSYDTLWSIYCGYIDWNDIREQKKSQTVVRTLHMNPDGVNLAPCVGIEDITRLHPGDLLYYRKNVGLVLKSKYDEKNNLNDIPVAQYVYTDNNHALRFCSLRFMSQVNPKYGSIWPCDRISFGNLDNTVTTEGIVSTSDGFDITQATVDYINSVKCEYMSRKPKFYQHGSCGWGNMPLFDIVMQFRTPGTKPGDWYVPAADELKQIYKEVSKFDEVRTQNNILELPEWEYATAWEIDEKSRVTFDMDTGHTHSDIKKEGRSDECVLAFLKVKLK